MGRHASPGPVGDGGGLRRPVALHQRPGQRPHRDDRPGGLQDQTDRGHPEQPDLPRRRLRDAELRIRARVVDDAEADDRQWIRGPRGLRGRVPRGVELAGDRPADRSDRPGRELPDRAAPLHAGSRRRGQAGQLRIRVHQLLQHRDGGRRQRRRRAAARDRSDRERLRLPAHHRLGEGRGGRGRGRVRAGERRPDDPPPDRDRRRDPVLRARAAEPPRRGHLTRRELHRRLGQARPERHGLRHRAHRGGDRQSGLPGDRSLRRPDPDVRLRRGRAGGGRRRTPSHAVRSRGERVHVAVRRQRRRHSGPSGRRPASPPRRRSRSSRRSPFTTTSGTS